MFESTPSPSADFFFKSVRTFNFQSSGISYLLVKFRDVEHGRLLATACCAPKHGGGCPANPLQQVSCRLPLPPSSRACLLFCTSVTFGHIALELSFLLYPATNTAGSNEGGLGCGTCKIASKKRI